MRATGAVPITPLLLAGDAMQTVTLTFATPAELLEASEALAKAAAGQPLTDSETTRLQIVALSIRASIPEPLEA